MAGDTGGTGDTGSTGAPTDGEAPSDAGGPSSDGGALASCAALLGDDGGAAAAGAATSEWVYVDPKTGKLAYKPLAGGDQILDFSYAGYMGGGVAPPSVPAAEMLQPSGGDDTAAIQAKLDAVGALPLVHGARGAVVLAAGTFQIAGTLAMNASGVVLRGSGSGMGGTTLDVTGTPRTVFTIGGSGGAAKGASHATITDAYVPSGATTFHVDDPSVLAVGGSVFVGRPVTAAWITFMGMDHLVRNDAAQTWLPVGAVLDSDRVITAITGDQVTVDVPLSDSLDAKYVSPPGASVTPYAFSARLAQIGLESLAVTAPSIVTAINVPIFELFHMDVVADAWVRDVAAQGFINGLSIGGAAKRVTLSKVSFVHTAAIDGSAGYPADFAIDGQQILLDRCASEGDHVFSAVTEATEPGPNVVLNLTSKGTATNLAPHQRWATGLLVDGLDSPTGGVDLMNRGTAGSGQGWAIGFGVLWNANAASMLVEQPPGSQNWAIGSLGTVTTGSTGAIDSPGKPVTPGSLYLAQLCERLGPQAVTAIGY
jgi:hypothetical protein